MDRQAEHLNPATYFLALEQLVLLKSARRHKIGIWKEKYPSATSNPREADW